MSTRSRSATIPFACSMTILLLRAWLRCSLRTWASSAVRCQEGDCRDVSESLGCNHIVEVERARLGAEQVEGSDDLATQAHRDRVGGLEAGPQCDRSELGHRRSVKNQVAAMWPSNRRTRIAGSVTLLCSRSA